MWPAGRFGGTRWAGATTGDYANPPTHGYGGSATHGGGLAAPHTFSLRQLSNRPHLLWLNSRPCLIPCRLWLPLWPLSSPMMFLWHSSHPLPVPLLWHLSRPWLPAQPPYLIARLGKPLARLCLSATGTQIVVAHSWMGEWCRRGGGCIAVTRMTMVFSGLT